MYDVSIIVKNDLRYISVAAKFVPHFLNDDKKSCKTVKVFAERITIKNMFILDKKQFFDKPVGNAATWS